MPESSGARWVMNERGGGLLLGTTWHKRGSLQFNGKLL
jgi:hypothetical protein